MTEGSEPVGSSLLSPAQGAGTSAVRLVLPDRQGPSCQTQGPVMTIEAVLLVIAGGAPGAVTSRPQASSFVGWVRRYISPLGQEKKENVRISRARACVLRRTPCSAGLEIPRSELRKNVIAPLRVHKTVTRE